MHVAKVHVSCVFTCKRYVRGAFKLRVTCTICMQLTKDSYKLNYVYNWTWIAKKIFKEQVDTYYLTSKIQSLYALYNEDGY